MNVTLIILALAAAFLGLRLYSVLGKRTGHEQEPTLPTAKPREQQRSTVPAILKPKPETPAPAMAGGASISPLYYEPEAEQGIRALLAADRSFNVGAFIEGAQSAYRMILEAYWQGDKDTLAALTDEDTYAAFAELIDERAARGETLDNRLVTIDDAVIRNVKLRADGALVHDLLLLQVKKPAESKRDWDFYHVKAVLKGDEVYPKPSDACPLNAKG